MEGISIKPVRIKKNYETISSMMRGLHVNERRLHDKTALWEEIEESYMRHVIEMQEDCDGLCLVVYVNDVAAGFIFGYVEEEDDSRIEEYTGRILYVSDGYVREEYRRMGIYSMLNTELERHYIDRGIKRIVRYTLAGNDNMHGFLKKEGYAATRVVYEKWL